MADDKDNEYEKTPTAGKGGSPASSTPNEEARGSGEDDADTANSRTPKESKESAGGKGGGLH
ncbi:MAG TPA: hypothetical protein VGO96_05590 [Pyrinomonadaceae bacterium]|jgi:hypothetical protein|nr:hypothetical protein [Pyrinomonadaceae bacterium]